MNIPKLRFKEFTDEWQEKKLGDIFDDIGGTSLEDQVVAGGSHKFISIGNYSTDGKYVDNGQRVNLNSKTQTKVPQKNDLLMVLNDKTSSGELIGSTILIDCSNLYVYNQRTERLMCNAINPKYAWLMLNSPKFRKKVYSLSQGGTQIYINFPVVKKIGVVLPSVNEQQKIANFLTAVDDKIEKLEAKKTQFEKYKKGVMQAIFLPCHSGLDPESRNPKIRFRCSDGSNYPDWEEKTVADIFQITRGNVLAINKIKKSPGEIHKYPVYSSQTLNNGLWGYYDNYLFENSITWTTDGANAGDVNFRSGKFYCTNVCGVLKSEDGYSNPCIAEILNRNTKKYVSYVGNPKLMNNVMGIIKITIPISVEEQQNIAEFLTSLDNKVELINKKLEQAKLFKKSLLQQMFA